MSKKLINDIKYLDNCIRIHILGNKKPSDYLNSTQMQIMAFLFSHENEDICQKDLEEETKLKKATITGAIDSLEDKGLVIRYVDENDARRRIIVLSEKANDLRNKIDEHLEQIEKKVISNIDEEDLKIFKRTLDAMIKNLKEGD